MQKLQNNLNQLIKSNPKLQTLHPHLKINLIQKNLHIQIINNQNHPMFKTNNTNIKPYIHNILHTITPILNNIPNHINLSNHTNNFPYTNNKKKYNN